MLWRCVLMWFWWAKVARGRVERIGCGSTGGDDRRDLLSSFASCTREAKIRSHSNRTATQMILEPGTVLNTHAVTWIHVCVCSRAWKVH